MERKTYYRENEDDEVKGFSIIESDDDRVRIAEKWNRPSAESTWTSYWVPKSQLKGRVEEGLCEKAGKLTDEQFEQVCQLTDPRALGRTKVEA